MRLHPQGHLAGHKLQPRVQALSTSKKPLRVKARGAGINLPIPLNESVSAQSSKRQCFLSFHAQQNCLRSFRQKRMSSILCLFKQTRMSSTLRSFRQTRKCVRSFHNSATYPVGSSMIRVHSFSAGVRPWPAKLVSGCLAPASYSSDG